MTAASCRLICPRCGYEASEGELACPRCGSFLVYSCHDVRWSVRRGTPSMWRYVDMLGFHPARVVTAGEGYTPLVRVGGTPVKLETRNPTGSYADRASSAIVSALPLSSYKVGYAVDFAASIAFYGRLVGASVTVVSAPESLDPFDVISMARSGAQIEFTSAGPTELRYDNQYTVEGLKTISFEILEQGRRPERVFVPASTGLLAFAMWKGFTEGAEALGTSEPELVAVRVKGSDEPYAVRLARGVKVISVDADEVISSTVRLAERGIYVRPLAAAAFTAAEAEGGLAVITGGLRRPELSHRRPSDLQSKILGLLSSSPSGMTAYDVWQSLAGYTLRGVYKALRALVDEGKACVSYSLKGRRKVRVYRPCAADKA